MPAVLMTLEDVQADLSLERLDILRLIARGTLPANVVGDEQYRIHQSAVEKVAYSNDLKAPSTYSGTNWIDSRPEEMRAGQFVANVKRVMADSVPAADPGEDRFMRYSGEVARLGNAPIEQPIPAVRQGDWELPYRSTAELYTVCQVRLMASQVVASKSLTARVQGKRPRSKMETLYSTPEMYQAIVAEALREYSRRGIYYRKSYTTGERRFTLRHNDIPFDIDRVIHLAF